LRDNFALAEGYGAISSDFLQFLVLTNSAHWTQSSRGGFAEFTDLVEIHCRPILAIYAKMPEGRASLFAISRLRYHPNSHARLTERTPGSVIRRSPISPTVRLQCKLWQ
jgi:hypothetical protein